MVTDIISVAISDCSEVNKLRSSEFDNADAKICSLLILLVSARVLAARISSAFASIDYSVSLTFSTETRAFANCT